MAENPYILPVERDANPYIQPQEPVDNPANQETYSTITGIIAAANGDTDPMQTYYESKAQFSEDIKNNIIESERQSKSLSLRSTLETLATDTPDEFSSLAPYAADVQAQIDNESQSPLAPFYAVIDTTTQVNLTPEDRNYMASQMFFKAHIQEIMAKESVGDIASDIAGMLLLPDLSKDTADVTGGSYFSSAADWKKYVLGFHEKPLEEQVKLFPVIKETMLREFEGNGLEVTNRLLQLIDPFSTEDFDLDLALDKLDAAGGLAILGAGVYKVFKTANMIKSLKTLGNTRLAAGITNTVLTKTDDVGKAVGIDKLDASAAASPFNMADELFEGSPNGLAEEIYHQNRAIDEGIKEAGERAIKENLPLDPAEIEKAIAKREKALKKLDNVENIEVVDSTDAGVTFKFDYITPADPFVKGDQIFKDLAAARKEAKAWYEKAKGTDNQRARGQFLAKAQKAETLAEQLQDNINKSRKSQRDTQSVTLNYTLDDITGGFKMEDLGVMRTVGKHLISPNFLFRKDRERLVETFTRLLFATEIHRRAFNKALTSVYDGISKTGRQNLDAILRHGDMTEQVFDYNTLRYTGIEGVTLNDKEIKAYYSTRHLMDKALHLKNQEIRDRLEAQGLKEILLSGNAQVVKPISTVQAASKAVSGSKYKKAYVEVGLDGTPDIVDLSDSETLSKFYDNGYILTRAPDQDFFKIGEENYVKYTLVKSEDISELPAMVVHGKTGYVPRDYKDGFYFAKKKEMGVVEGNDEVVALTTERYFSSKAEAEAFVKGRNLQYLTEKYGDDVDKIEKAMEKPDDLPYMTLHDREMLSNDFDKEVAGISGGLYTGARKEEALRQGISGLGPDFIPAIESIQKYFDHLSVRMPMAKYRVGIETRWLNHAREVGGLPRDYKGSFQHAINEIDETIHPSIRTFLEKSHKQILYQVRVPTTGEQEMVTKMRALAEWTEEKKWFGAKTGSVVKALHNLDHTDVVSAMRTATFHTFLGFLSPAQFMVQGFGATVAMSIEPTLMPKVLPRVFALHTLDNITNPATLEKVIAQMSKTTGMDDLGEAYAAWRRTGMHESIVTSSADYKSMTRSHHIGKDMVGRLLDKGLFFYKAGELFNRRTSFMTSYMKWKELNKGKKMTDNDLKAVINEANQFMLNMTRSNKTAWQKGAMSVPTQFLQIHTKYVEALLGDQFTKAERARLMLMQLGLFGAAGVPFMSTMQDNAVAVAGVEPGDLSEETIIAMREGLVGTFFKTFLNADVDVTKRGAIGLGIQEVLQNILVGEASLTDVALGAFGGLTTRAANNITAAYNIFDSADFSPSNLSPSDFTAAADVLLDTISSWNNASMAYEMFNNPMLRDSKGRPSIMTDQNVQTKIFAALGFRPADLSRIYTRNMSDREVNNRLNEKMSAINSVFHRRFSDNQEFTEDDVRRVDAMLESMIASESPAEQQEIKERFYRQLLKNETNGARAFNKSIERLINEIYSSEDVFDPALSKALEEAE